MKAKPHVPGAVFDATRSLFRLRSGSSARLVAEHLVRELGGQLVPAGSDGPDVIPVDVSFGDGDPLLPAAAPGSVARALLERHLATFLLDARLVLQLNGQNAAQREVGQRWYANEHREGIPVIAGGLAFGAAREPTTPDPVALHLNAEADALGGAAFDGLTAAFRGWPITTSARSPAPERISCSSSNSWPRRCSLPTRPSSATSSTGCETCSSNAACRRRP